MIDILDKVYFIYQDHLHSGIVKSIVIEKHVINESYNQNNYKGLCYMQNDKQNRYNIIIRYIILVPSLERPIIKTDGEVFASEQDVKNHIFETRVDGIESTADFYEQSLTPHNTTVENILKQYLNSYTNIMNQVEVLKHNYNELIEKIHDFNHSNWFKRVWSAITNKKLI